MGRFDYGVVVGIWSCVSGRIRGVEFYNEMEERCTERSFFLTCINPFQRMACMIIEKGLSESR